MPLVGFGGKEILCVGGATTVYWKAGFGAPNSTNLITWAVDADGGIVPPEEAIRPEVIPEILYTNDGCAVNDFRKIFVPDIPLYNFGADEVVEPDPETIELTLLPGETMYFFVKFSDAYTDVITATLENDTTEPDLTLAPTGDKWVMLYTVTAATMNYTEDAVGIQRSGIRYLIEQYNEGCLDLTRPYSPPYIIITSVIDFNNYLGDVIQVGDPTPLVVGVTIMALEPDAGQPLKVGRKMFAAAVVDDVYFIQPSVAYGA